MSLFTKHCNPLVNTFYTNAPKLVLYRQPVYKETKTSKSFNGSLVNISNITRLSWNQFRCISVRSVHKRITVFSRKVLRSETAYQITPYEWMRYYDVNIYFFLHHCGSIFILNDFMKYFSYVDVRVEVLIDHWDFAQS